MSDIALWVFSVLLVINLFAHVYTNWMCWKYRRECRLYNKQHEIEFDAFAESVLEEINNKVGTRKTPWR